MSAADHKALPAPADLRVLLVGRLRDVASGLLLDPGLNTKKWEQTAALQALLEGYEALVRATSTSNRGYELRDLPAQEKDAYEQAKHVIRTLTQLHGPQNGEKA